VHVWDLAVRDQPWIAPGSPIRATFSVADLRAALRGTGVTQVVLVQVINDAAETADFLSAAQQEDIVAGVIGWADLAAPGIAEELAGLAAVGRLVGVRHQALAEAEPAEWLRSPQARRGLAAMERASLPFDLLLRPAHLRAAVDVVRAHPSLLFVLNHLGKPAIATGRLEPWLSGIRALAAEPNVFCKLSGVQTVATRDWSYPDLAPFLEAALHAFGAERIIFGSDWPVSTQAASYRQVLDVATQACAALSPDERCAVLAGNARRVYRL
jgi:L-fuconolactonase